MMSQIRNRSVNLEQAIFHNDLESTIEIIKTNNIIPRSGLLELASYKLPITKYLLEANVNPNSERYLPLHKHCMVNGHFEILKLYIKYGAKLNATDHMGRTALMIACGARIHEYPPLDVSQAIGNVEAVRILVDAGASINLKCNSGFTAFDYARDMYNLSNFYEIDTGKAPIIFTNKEREKAMASYRLIIDILINCLTAKVKVTTSNNDQKNYQKQNEQSKL